MSHTRGLGGEVGGWSRRTELGRFLHAALFDPVPRDHRESDSALRRRRIVVAVTLVCGAALLGISLNLTPGDNRFYLLTILLAILWTVGSLAAGPLHLGWARTRSRGRTRPVVQPIALGVLITGIALAIAVGIAQVPPLRAQVDSVLDHARFASLPLVGLITLVNGLAEELFFRGALYAAIQRAPVLWTTLLYALTTAATGNAMLVFAAGVIGLVVGLQRRVTGGILGPMLTHVIWSLSMLCVLPWLIGAAS
ncbi:MAG: lysostaphin resistance A-like protein [Dermatophilaceae bacterium]